MSHRGGLRSRPGPPSVLALYLIEAAVALTALEDPVINVATATLFQAYATARTEQTQSCYMTDICDGVLQGVYLLDKHPNPFKRVPRPFWCPVNGLMGTDLWLRLLMRTLQGREQACCMFLENDSPDGDPFRASRLYAAPMSKDRILVAKRAVYQRLARVPAELLLELTLHSERHFLPHLAQANEEAPEDAVEVGGWAGSTAQDPDLQPDVRAHRAHRLRLGQLPQRYGLEAKVARVARIKERLMAAARGLILRAGANLPTTGGWHMLAPPRVGPSSALPLAERPRP